MENKNNFMGIIIPVVVAVILLTVLPIINSINKECPPCEECPSYDIGQLNINPDFSSGNYIIDKGSYDYIDSATIIKDTDLIPENIKKDVNIFGVVGTLEHEPTEQKVNIFEDGTILPATTQLLIISHPHNIHNHGGIGQIKTDNDNFVFCDYNVDFDETFDFFINGINYQSIWSSQPYIIIDTSSWSLSKRTVSTVSGIFTESQKNLIFWDVS